MIEFHNDRLVPQELCRILYQAVPKGFHVPVRFHNRRRRDLYGEHGSYPLGSMSAKKNRTQPSYIIINLNPIYGAGFRYSRSYASAPSSSIWRELLNVCLHEFGHVATLEMAHHMNLHEYHRAPYGTVYMATERLADEWRDHRVAKILKNDPRLGQPRRLTGYFGARLMRWTEWVKERPWHFMNVAERRCSWTGAQLTAGDVLRQLSIEPQNYTNAYRVLRRSSDGIGVDYADRAGRRHKLYAWGDVPLIAERLAPRTGELVHRNHIKSSDFADYPSYEDLPF